MEAICGVGLIWMDDGWMDADVDDAVTIPYVYAMFLARASREKI